MCLYGMVLTSVPASNILSMGDRLEMVGVDAGADPAQMIEMLCLIK